jgi:hypothetical protein
MNTDFWVRFWYCRHCNKEHRAPLSTFQRLSKVLPSQSNPVHSVVLLCAACNRLQRFLKAWNSFVTSFDAPIVGLRNASHSIEGRLL